MAAFDDLDAPDTLELLRKAPDPPRAAKLTRAQISAVLKHAGRYQVVERTEAILAQLRSPQLSQPPALCQPRLRRAQRGDLFRPLSTSSPARTRWPKSGRR